MRIEDMSIGACIVVIAKDDGKPDVFKKFGEDAWYAPATGWGESPWTDEQIRKDHLIVFDFQPPVGA